MVVPKVVMSYSRILVDHPYKFFDLIIWNLTCTERSGKTKLLRVEISGYPSNDALFFNILIRLRILLSEQLNRDPNSLYGLCVTGKSDWISFKSFLSISSIP